MTNQFRISKLHFMNSDYPEVFLLIDTLFAHPAMKRGKQTESIEPDEKNRNSFEYPTLCCWCKKHFFHFLFTQFPLINSKFALKYWFYQRIIKHGMKSLYIWMKIAQVLWHLPLFQFTLYFKRRETKSNAIITIFERRIKKKLLNNLNYFLISFTQKCWFVVIKIHCIEFNKK